MPFTLCGSLRFSRLSSLCHRLDIRSSISILLQSQSAPDKPSLLLGGHIEYPTCFMGGATYIPTQSTNSIQPVNQFSQCVHESSEASFFTLRETFYGMGNYCSTLYKGKERVWVTVTTRHWRLCHSETSLGIHGRMPRREVGAPHLATRSFDFIFVQVHEYANPSNRYKNIVWSLKLLNFT